MTYKSRLNIALFATTILMSVFAQAQHKLIYPGNYTFTTKYSFEYITKEVYDIRPRDTILRQKEYKAYDDDGHLLLHRRDLSADGSFESVRIFEYDTAGNEVLVLDQFDSSRWRVHYKKYNNNGRLISHAFGLRINGRDTNIVIQLQNEFDSLGRLIKETESRYRETIIKTYKYDNLGRLTEKRINKDQDHFDEEVWTYKYDHDGVTECYFQSITNGNKYDEITTEIRDLNNRLTYRKIETDDLIRTRSLSYNDKGLLSYDSSYRSYERKGYKGIDINVFSFEYSYEGQLIKKLGNYWHRGKKRWKAYSDSNTRTWDYSYDARGNLIEEVAPSKTIKFKYDQLNNLIMKVEDINNDGKADHTNFWHYDSSLLISKTYQVGQNSNIDTLDLYQYDKYNNLYTHKKDLKDGKWSEVIITQRDSNGNVLFTSKGKQIDENDEGNWHFSRLEQTLITDSGKILTIKFGNGTILNRSVTYIMDHNENYITMENTNNSTTLTKFGYETPACCASISDAPAHRFTLRINETGIYTISLKSDEFQPKLLLSKKRFCERTIESLNDNYKTKGDHTFNLQKGDYFLTVTGASTNDQGKYQLSISLN